MTHIKNDLRLAILPATTGPVLLLILALIAAPLTLKAQTAGEGTITGTVTDKQVQRFPMRP